jgi:hypothetical protein
MLFIFPDDVVVLAGIEMHIYEIIGADAPKHW